MRDLVKDLPNQLKHALEVSKEMRITQPDNDINNIVIAGLGGSGIGGAIVQSILLDELQIPLTTVNTYDIPGYVDPNTLFIASSFSGNTEETISAYYQAQDEGAKICCITAGGKIRFLADSANDDLAILPHHIKSPRANIGYSVVQLLFVLEAYGLISDSFKQEVENTVQLLQKEEKNIEAEAKKLADLYKDKLPILYTGDRVYPIAVRNQQQINENAKQFCHVNRFPEFNHNELVGWQFPAKVFAGAVVTYIYTDFDHARVKLRMETCKKTFTEKSSLAMVHAKGASFIEQAYYIIHLFDLVSVNLADLNNIDPTPVEIIDHLKEELDKVE